MTDLQLINRYGGGIVFYTKNGPSPTKILEVDGYGNVLVQGNIEVQGTTTFADIQISDQLVITNTGTGPALDINQTGAQPVVSFKDDGTTVFNVADGGAVTIGPATGNALTHVVQAGASATLQINAGNTNNTAKLVINASGTTGISSLELTRAGTTKWSLNNNASDQLEISSSSSTAATIEATGKWAFGNSTTNQSHTLTAAVTSPITINTTATGGIPIEQEYSTYVDLGLAFDNSFQPGIQSIGRAISGHSGALKSFTMRLRLFSDQPPYIFNTNAQLTAKLYGPTTVFESGIPQPGSLIATSNTLTGVDLLDNQYKNYNFIFTNPPVLDPNVTYALLLDIIDTAGYAAIYDYIAQTGSSVPSLDYLLGKNYYGEGTTAIVGSQYQAYIKYSILEQAATTTNIKFQSSGTDLGYIGYDTNNKLLFTNNGGSVTTGEVTSSGAWTFGSTASALSHKFTSAAQTVVQINSATGSPTYVDFLINDSSQALIGVSGTTNSLVTGSLAGDLIVRTQGKNLYITTDSGATQAGRISTSNAWTIGNSSTSNNKHTIHGGISIQSARSTFTANSEALALALRYNTSGSSFFLGANASHGLQFSSASESSLSSLTQAGAWTFGPSSSSQTHTVNGILQIAARASGANQLQLAGFTSGTLNFKTPNTITTYTLTLPNSQGAASTTLVNDGSGNLSWGSSGAAIGSAVSGGTSGSVLFINGSGNLAQNNSKFFWNNTNNRLGLGTTTPSATLEISSTEVETFKVIYSGGDGDSRMLFTNTGNTAHMLFLSGNSVGTNGGSNAGNSLIDFRKTKALIIGASTDNNLASRTNYVTVRGDDGRVGIGTTNPTSLLSVGSSSQFQVNSSGNIVRVNNVPLSFPASQGAANSTLVNDGAGNLTWGAGGGLVIPITQNSHGFTSADIGRPLYLNGSTYTLAQADTEAKAEVAGLVKSIVSANVFEICLGGEVSNIGSNLVQGTLSAPVLTYSYTSFTSVTQPYEYQGSTLLATQSGNISSITLTCQVVLGSVTGQVWAEIYALSNQAADGIPTGPVLATSESINIGAIPVGDVERTYTVNFTTTTNLTAGTYYALILKTTVTGGTGQFRVYYYNGVGIPANTRLFYIFGGTWYSSTFSGTLVAQVYVQGTTTSLTPGEVYFLSASEVGKITTTPPSVVGQISKPIGIARTSSALDFFNMRGSAVGGSNAYTQIGLAGSTSSIQTTTIQNVSTYDSVELSGWIYLNATTKYRFLFKAQVTKKGDNTDYLISFQTSGDTPPVGFDISVTAAGLVQVVLPALTGFTSAIAQFSLNGPAVGASLPLQIDSSNVSFSSVQAKDTNGISFKRSNGLSAGTLNDSGYWLRPSQPIISGQMGTALTDPTGPQKLAFNEFWVNRGITYDSVNRRFYVPVAGVYRITLNPFFKTGVSARRVLVGINNDAPTQTTHYGHTYSENAEYETGCINSIVSLNANDYVVFYLQSGALYNNTSDKFNQFSIELIG